MKKAINWLNDETVRTPEWGKMSVPPPDELLKGDSEWFHDYSFEHCLARCKQSGKCYGKAYFDGKPGKNGICVPGRCQWMK